MMKYLFASTVVILVLLLALTGCGQKAGDEPAAKKEVNMEWQVKADSFLKKYETEAAKLEKAATLAEWSAETTGKKEDFDAFAAADLALKQLHSDKKRYAELEELLTHKDQLKPMTIRSLVVISLEFKENLLDKETLQKLVNGETEIKQVFNTTRGKIDGKALSNNELLDMLKTETDTAKRKKTWEALKQVGDAVAQKLIALAKERNTAAQSLGYKNYWDMKIRLDEHDPQELMAIFTELETVTNEPFKQMKAKLDAELAARFNVKAEEMMPWHYDNPFFQAAPPSDKIDLDEFYKDKPREEIIELAKKFLKEIDLPVEDIVARSDLYEREGKNQHAFCTDIDRNGDVRILVNITPTAEEMDTTLHELGHGVYDLYMDLSLPWSLRGPAHKFTTEGIAMLFGALAKTPTWMVSYAGADPERVKQMEAAILEQRRREQLIFARWSMVMINFEKAFYENPDQDLNKLWWDMVERFQFLKRPEGRNAADWAAKPHFTIAPVYYHNYMLGELFAAQLRNTLVKLGKHDGPSHKLQYEKHPEFGTFFKDKIFKPANTAAWPEFVKNATGEPLSAKFFAKESSGS